MLTKILWAGLLAALGLLWQAQSTHISGVESRVESLEAQRSAVPVVSARLDAIDLRLKRIEEKLDRIPWVRSPQSP